MMNRSQAIEMVGIKNVVAAEAVNCELTNRVGGNGLINSDPFLEYEGKAKIDYTVLSAVQKRKLPVLGGWIVAVYRVSNEIEQRAKDADCDIWDFADISIDDYQID
jgi:hypothetical protein